jgi:Domain of unknown function (DUF4190)
MSANDQGSASTTGRTSPLAIAALACGVSGFLIPPAFLASIILGHVVRRQIRLTGERGKGIATAGMILGYLFLAWLTVLVLALVVFANAHFA